MAGFDVIDGIDLSADMLALAKDKNIYRNLAQIDGDATLIHPLGTYAAIAAIGVIGAGAAPVTVFDGLMQSLDKGGLFVFSFNDHALQHPGFEGRVNEWTDCGAARLLMREYGPHLPGIDVKANVYVLEKA